MRPSDFTPDEDKFIFENARKVKWSILGAKLGRTDNQVKGRFRYLLQKMVKQPVVGPSKREDHTAQFQPTGKEFKKTEAGNQLTLESTDDRIRTPEDLIKARNIDLKVWKVKKAECGQHEGFYRDRSMPISKKHPHRKGWVRTHKVVTLYSVKLTLERIDPVENSNNSLRLELIEDMKRYAPSYPKTVRPRMNLDEEPCMFEASIFDPHFGKLAWGKETGQKYDLDIAAKACLEAAEYLLGKAQNHNVEQILIPLGNDMLHVDNADNATTNRTRQDVDGRRHKAFLYAKRFAIQFIDMALSIAPVKVVIVPGNHDRESTFFLGDTIESWYNKCKDVVVDNAPPLRKYVEYGTNLLGFTHGSEEEIKRLNNLMQVEQKQAWARCSHYEWHLGHLHIKRKRESFFVNDNTVDTLDGGVVTRWLPSLCATDAWHAMMGYVGSPRSAEGYIWGKESGYCGHVSFNFKG